MSASFSTLALALLLGLLSSFYGSITGGAALLSIPGMLLLGMPADIAIATTKFGDLGRFASASYQFTRSGKIHWRYVIALAPLALIGGIVGARLVIDVDPASLGTSIGVMMLALLPLLFLSRDLGLKPRHRGHAWHGVGIVGYILLVLYGAGVQVGSGPMILYLMMLCFGFTILQANATSSVCWLFIIPSSLATYMYFGVMDYPHAAALFAGSLAGGFLGTRTALGKGDRWTRNLFALVIALMGVKLLVESFG